MITQTGKFNHCEDDLLPTNLAKFVAKQITYLKDAQKIYVAVVIKKDILLPFVLNKHQKEMIARPATKVDIPIDNALKTIVEDVIN
jgi:predicted transglutaminase-like protease